MALQKRDKTVLHVRVDVLCAVNRTHQLGVAVLYLEPHPQAGRLVVGNGLVFDEHGRASVDCPECAVVGRGRDQRISRRRLVARAHELLAVGRTEGKLQA
ncbi:MAG: hypothetical protein ACR2KG_13355 [Nocardioidaceae bacterium]